MEGISSLQLLHQVAQKFTKTTLPRREDRVNSFPFMSVSVKSGAYAPTTTGSYLLLLRHTIPTIPIKITRAMTKVLNLPLPLSSFSFSIVVSAICDPFHCVLFLFMRRHAVPGV